MFNKKLKERIEALEEEVEELKKLRPMATVLEANIDNLRKECEIVVRDKSDTFIDCLGYSCGKVIKIKTLIASILDHLGLKVEVKKEQERVELVPMHPDLDQYEEAERLAKKIKDALDGAGGGEKWAIHNCRYYTDFPRN